MSSSSKPAAGAARSAAQIKQENAELRARIRELEADRERLTLAVQASGLGIFDIPVPLREGSYHSEAWAGLLGYARSELPPSEIFLEWFLAHIHPDDLARVRAEFAAFASGAVPAYNAEFRMRHRDGHWVYAKSSGIAGERDGEGRVTRMIGVMQDVTPIHDAQAALLEARDEVSEKMNLFEAILRSSRDNIYVVGLDRRIRYVGSEAAAAFEAFGIPKAALIGRTIEELALPDMVKLPALQALSPKMAESLSTGQRTTTEVTYFVPGIPLTMEYHIDPLRSPKDESVIGLVVTSRNISERRQHERQQQLLMGELSHRVKNTLAVVQAMARQTQKSTSSVEEFLGTFTARLRALGAAHEIVTRSNWTACPLDELIRVLLQPHIGDGCMVTLEAHGIEIRPHLVFGLTLALHELATNAQKHGALSRGGLLDLRAQSLDDGERTFALIWHESHDQPVAPPDRQGFGLRLIRQAAEFQLGGTIEFDWQPNGLVCRMVIPRRDTSPPLWQLPLAPASVQGQSRGGERTS